MNPSITINSRPIGSDHPVYIIAEMSANHGQDIGHAKEIIHAMKESGADCVKIQTYTPDTMTIDSDKKWFQVGEGTIWEGRSLYDLYGEAYTPWEWQAELKALVEELGMDFFSTPYEETAIDFLEDIGVAFYKVASFELIDTPLIARIAETGKPMIMSTGMATLDEITQAVETARSAGANDIILLKCTSAYPASADQANLSCIPDLMQRFDLPVGLSDHTLDIVVPVAAVSLGACVIEKHFTLSRATPGPDSAFSLEPDEFKAMAAAARTAQKTIGTPEYKITKDEEATAVFRRSIFVVEDVQAGDTFTTDNVRRIRPGYGLAPSRFAGILGKKAAVDIERGTPLSEEMIA